MKRVQIHRVTVRTQSEPAYPHAPIPPEVELPDDATVVNVVPGPGPFLTVLYTTEVLRAGWTP